MLNVAAYARVSTDKDDQINSLESQKRYFEAMIQANPEWNFVGIYADEGITGTSVKKRLMFQKLIADALSGKIDLILTKEVSRFARNTVDTLSFAQELKRHGVYVYFTTDHLNTMNDEDDFRLTIMAGVAQEESRKTSKRVKWGQQRRMESGVVFGNNSIYGFDLRHGKLTVIPQEADVVRRIFHLYTNEGKGSYVIARELNSWGVTPPRSWNWSEAMVRRILHNEKYVGDLLQKKFCTVDYLNHTKIPNRQIEQQIYLRDHHEAVIDRALWNRTQQELEKRSRACGSTEKYSNKYWCSGKITCGYCGSKYGSKLYRKNGHPAIHQWVCREKNNNGRKQAAPGGKTVGCDNKTLHEKVLHTVMQQVLFQFREESQPWLEELAGTLARTIPDSNAADYGRQDQCRDQIQRLRNQKQKLIGLYLEGDLTKEEWMAEKLQYNQKIEELRFRLQDLERQEEIARRQRGNPPDFFEQLRTIATQQKDATAWYGELLERILVYGNVLQVKLRYLPQVYEVTYATRRKQGNFEVEIQKIERKEVFSSRQR